MIQCTEPATPAVIALCELPVSIQEAVLGLKTPYPITVLSERERASFGSCEWSRSHTLEKSRSKEERPVQAIFRQTQTDASRRRQTVDVTRSLDNNISSPKFIWSAQPKCWPRPIFYSILFYSHIYIRRHSQ